MKESSIDWTPLHEAELTELEQYRREIGHVQAVSPAALERLRELAARTDALIAVRRAWRQHSRVMAA
jgi:hypothetical protein